MSAKRVIWTMEDTHIIDKNVNGLSTKLADQLSSIILLLGLFDTALKVPIERLLAPVTVDWIRDGRKGRARAVLLRALADRVEVDRERSMASHGVPEDGLAREVLRGSSVDALRGRTSARAGTHDGEAGLLDDLRQLDGDVREHVVVLRILRVRRVHVEAGALGGEGCDHGCSHDLSRSEARTDAKVPGVCFALDACAARRGVWEEDRDALLGGGAEEGALLRAVRGGCEGVSAVRDVRRTHALSSVQVRPDR